MVAELIASLAYLVLYFCLFRFYPILFIIFVFILMDVFNSTPICLYGMRKSFGPPKFVEPIITPGYELRPCLIKMIQDKPFSGVLTLLNATTKNRLLNLSLAAVSKLLNIT